MTSYVKQPATALHDITTGALIGFLGANGKEYLLQSALVGAVPQLAGDVNANSLTAGYRAVTTATDTVAATDSTITANYAGTVTETLPAAASSPGRIICLRTIQAQTVVSASANVVPLIGGAAGTAILAATAGKWAELQSDGTNWQIIAAN